jgi:hypothetical protein
MLKNIRNNYRVIDEDPKRACDYWERLKEFCPIEIEESIAAGLNPKFRFYRYEIGQRYLKHRDGRVALNELEESRITFMIYLNDNFEGGSTSFKEIVIRPKTGMAVCFIHEEKHESVVIESGVKYVLRSDVVYRTK